MCIKNIDLFSVNCANVINGKLGFCACHSCSELEGDCDFNDQCQEGLICGSNNCQDSLGFDAQTDCCYVANVGDEDFCTTDEPCEADEGDCDSNDECKSHLFCGSNNCPTPLCSSICGFPHKKGDDYCDNENDNCGCECDGGDCCDSNVDKYYCSACECLTSDDDCCEPKGDKKLLVVFKPISV